MKLLAVDEGFIGSLQCAIGLRDAGHDVVLVAAVGANRSTYTSASFVAEMGPAPDAPDFIQHAVSTAARHACTCILPMTEPAMLAIDAAAPQFTQTILPRLNALQRTLVADKYAMSEFAEQCGVLIPRQERVTDERQFDRIVRKLGVPLVVKPTWGRGGAQTYICGNVHTARAAITRHLSSGRACIAQEFIAGSTYLVGGLFDRGRPLRLYAGEKIEQQPPATGPASHIVSVRDAKLTDAALRILHRLEWTGLASADLIRSADDRWYFLEVNPRPWGSIAAAADAGADLFRPLAALMRGDRPAADLNYAAGIATRILPLYLLNKRRWLDPRTVPRLWSDLMSRQGAPFRDMRCARHIVQRLRRVRANWPS